MSTTGPPPIPTKSPAFTPTIPHSTRGVHETWRVGKERRRVAEYLRQPRLSASTTHSADRGSLSAIGRTDHGNDQGRSGASSAQPAQSKADCRLDRGTYATRGGQASGLREC